MTHSEKKNFVSQPDVQLEVSTIEDIEKNEEGIWNVGCNGYHTKWTRLE